MDSILKSIEICAGAGGQALGLEEAGFEHLVLVEIEKPACDTLKFNRPDWNVQNMDVHFFDGTPYRELDVDLLAGGVPCPPFSDAGLKLGDKDERDLFPEALRLVSEINPKAVMLENVKGLFNKDFDNYRNSIEKWLNDHGYETDWRLINSSDFGVPQLRPRTILIAMKPEYFKHFHWPHKKIKPKTVGEVLYEDMSSQGWLFAERWKQLANDIAPTLVGGSKKHGGADLGPTRAKKQWEQLFVDGKGLADAPPVNGYEGMPRLTVGMAAKIQGFPAEWQITGKKTPAYRQVGNAFPPPVAKSIGNNIKEAIINGRKEQRSQGKAEGVFS
ncbi:DNA cytosine methyltransferase [Algoriphagus jejuensis]|uniref:Cytosine-specific methyltransferase n=1 Tax=Algoriphagus jejuensis TaxID=419934 RepID=A0ABP3YDM3_9BACT